MMRPPLRQSIPFTMSVEGETEKWYFEHLRKLINGSQEARYNLTLRCKVNKSPLDMAKCIVMPGGKQKAPNEIWHVFDYESESEQHRKEFQEALRQMKEAGEIGKRIRYKCAYSNYTFDLWMILHKTQAVHCADRNDYLRQINKAYGTQYSNMHEYKQESNFKKLLDHIDLADVNAAVERAKAMNKETLRQNDRTAEYCGYQYCLENPYTDVHLLVSSMLAKTNTNTSEMLV